MMFNSVDVLIEYRFDAGDSLPTHKLLMGRVVQQTPDGPVYGDNLINCYCVGITTAEEMVVRKLRKQTRAVNFLYGKHLEQKTLFRQIS